MLVLSRKRQEAILVALEGRFDKENTIEIRIIDISGHRVVVGVQAPKKYTIIRKELKEKSS